MRFKIFTFFFLVSLYMGAQNKANLETSFNLGFPSFQTDYGENGDFKSEVSGNIGIAVSASMYINFFNKDPMYIASPSWVQKHTKLKIEASYQTAKLEHFGAQIEGNLPNAKKLRNMHGRSTLINLGTILEYHPFPIPDFIPGTRRNISPYFSLGVLADYSTPTVESDLGDWEKNPYVLIEAYQGDEIINIEPTITYSIVFGGGMRYNLDNGSAIVLDYRWQYFNTDYIDGLQPDPEIVRNKYNDWLSFLSVGYVFTLGESSGRSSTW